MCACDGRFPMPSFRALPTSLRPAVRPKSVDANGTASSPAKPVLVDCGVYVDGNRLAGDYRPIEALAKVREVERNGQEAFVWIGLCEDP